MAGQHWHIAVHSQRHQHASHPSVPDGTPLFDLFCLRYTGDNTLWLAAWQASSFQWCSKQLCVDYHTQWSTDLLQWETIIKGNKTRKHNSGLAWALRQIAAKIWTFSKAWLHTDWWSLSLSVTSHSVEASLCEELRTEIWSGTKIQDNRFKSVFGSQFIMFSIETTLSVPFLWVYK